MTGEQGGATVPGAPRAIGRRAVLGATVAGASLLRVNILHAQSEPIRIGFPVALTGPYSSLAQDQVRAAALAVAEFNDSGGLDGRKAELLPRDDKINPGEAATRTLELI